MFPGLDETRKWVEALKGAIVVLFHERLVSPELNERILREDLESYENFKSTLDSRLDGMAPEFGWDPITLQAKKRMYEEKLKSDWLDRAHETFELSRIGSRFIGMPIKEEARCFPE